MALSSQQDLLERLIGITEDDDPADAIQVATFLQDIARTRLSFEDLESFSIIDTTVDEWDGFDDSWTLARTFEPLP